MAICGFTTQQNTAVVILAVLAVAGFARAQTQCVDVDQKAYNVTGSNLTQTTRDKMSENGLYCDITISWQVTAASALDKTKHQAAYELYRQLYAQATTDSIDGERKAGITKDCLAFSYKAFCAYSVPKCSNGKDVTQESFRTLDSALRPATHSGTGVQRYALLTKESKGLIDLVCKDSRDSDCATASLLSLAMMFFAALAFAILVF